MTSIVITGKDTLTLFGRVIADQGDGDVATLDFPNDLMGMKSGKNGNTIFSENATGKNADLTIRLLRGSSDARFLQGKMNSQLQDSTGFTLATGQVVKNIGDGQGNRARDVYTLTGGMFVKIPGTKENVEGDTEQGMAVFTMRFADVAWSTQ